MTNEEAIKIINVAILEIEWSYPMEYAEAFDKAIEALEKQEAKKPVLGGSYPNIKEWECPNCKSYFAKLDDRPNYCCECGQKIEWGN